MRLDNLKNIHLASDHAGFQHKEEILKWLQGSIYIIHDHGAYVNDPLDDFPDFMSKAAVAVSNSIGDSCAIIFGGSGQGEAMAVNRFSKIRATVYYGGNPEIIKLSRLHNDANILAIGARFITVEETKKIITTWLSLEVDPDEKYHRRNLKLCNLPN